MVHEFDHRIAYADTDRMGVVYYANYLVLFERGRTEWLRSLGLRYRDLEEDPGVVLPVVRVECNYMAPARYDDMIRIRTWVGEMGGAHVIFQHEILDAETGKLLAKGYTKHPFVDRKTWRPVRAPAIFREAYRKWLKPS
jgi:acyl-CoA thioester hydrolase